MRNSFLQLLGQECLKQGLTSVAVTGDISPVELVGLATRADMVFVDELVDTGFPFTHEIVVHEDVELCREEGELFHVDGKIIASDLELSLMPLFLQKLQNLSAAVPVWACILIGGKSSRMGFPKHLLTGMDGVSWLERTVNLISPLVSGVVVSGAGELPESLATIPRLVDIPGVAGPLNGIIAASRWQPLVSWLVVACYMPHLTGTAVSWLLADRPAGEWGRLPHMPGDLRGEPLFSWYDMRAAHLFEAQLFSGNMRMDGVASHPKIISPEIPPELASAWSNINTPEELQHIGP